MRNERTTRRLAEAVLAILNRPQRSAVQLALSSFGLDDWKRSYYWLDASGVALYLLEAVKQHHLEDLFPIGVIMRLQQNQTDNRRRSFDLFEEFVTINEMFHRGGVRYVNLKGFSLIPDYCREPALRYQLDLDFLVSPSDSSKCRELMSHIGYRLVATGDHALEFKAREDRPPTIDRLYQPRSERVVELHLACPPFVPGRTDELISRSAVGSWNGYRFPVLCPRDMFLAQSFHLMRHIRSEWTRLSWLLEFKYFVAGWRGDLPIWLDVQKLAKDRDSITAIGVVTLLATELFGDFAPREMTEWSVDSLPVPVRLWISRYAREAILADFPGTKLYLLLEQALATDTVVRRKARRSKLLPSRLPGKIVDSTNSRSWKRVWGRLIQARYVLFRLWFHLAASIRYGLEVRSWRRAVSLAEEVGSKPMVGDRYTVMASGTRR